MTTTSQQTWLIGTEPPVITEHGPVGGPSQALHLAGFSLVSRSRTDEGVVVDWQRRRTNVRLLIVPGVRAWTAVVSTPGGHVEVITDLARLVGRCSQ